MEPPAQRLCSVSFVQYWQYAVINLLLAIKAISIESKFLPFPLKTNHTHLLGIND